MFLRFRLNLAATKSMIAIFYLAGKLTHFNWISSASYHYNYYYYCYYYKYFWIVRLVGSFQPDGHACFLLLFLHMISHIHMQNVEMCRIYLYIYSFTMIQAQCKYFRQTDATELRFVSLQSTKLAQSHLMLWTSSHLYQ